jgi:hypothetical protein
MGCAEMEMKAGKTGCDGHPMNNGGSGLRQGIIGNKGEGRVEAERHDCWSARRDQIQEIAYKHRAGGYQTSLEGARVQGSGGEAWDGIGNGAGNDVMTMSVTRSRTMSVTVSVNGNGAGDDVGDDISNCMSIGNCASNDAGNDVGDDIGNDVGNCAGNNAGDDAGNDVGNGISDGIGNSFGNSFGNGVSNGFGNGVSRSVKGSGRWLGPAAATLVPAVELGPSGCWSWWRAGQEHGWDTSLGWR